MHIIKSISDLISALWSLNELLSWTWRTKCSQKIKTQENILRTCSTLSFISTKSSNCKYYLILNFNLLYNLKHILFDNCLMEVCAIWKSMELLTYSFDHIASFLYLTTSKMFWLHVNNFCRVCWKVLVSPSPKTSTLLTQWKLTFHLHYCGHLFPHLLPYSRSSKISLFQLLFIFNLKKYQKWAFAWTVCNWNLCSTLVAVQRKS